MAHQDRETFDGIPPDDGVDDEHYEGADEAAAAEEEQLAAEKARKDKKFKMMLIGVAAVLLSAGGVYKYVLAPAKTGSPTQSSFAQGQAPAASAPTMQAPTMQAPGQTPSPAPQDALVQVPTGAPPGDQLAAPQMPQQAIQSPPAEQASPTAVIVQAPAANVAAPSDAFPAPATPARAAVAGTSEGFGRGIDEIGKKIDDLKAMFTKFDDMKIDEHFEKIEARLAALEGKRPGVASNSTEAKPAASRHRAAKVSAQRKARASKAAKSKVSPISESDDLLFSRSAEGQPSVKKESDGRGYSLQAVIPGRIWIKGPDGNSQTFERGETLPDGVKILKIDPDRGDVVTNKGVLRFPSK